MLRYEAVIHRIYYVSVLVTGFSLAGGFPIWAAALRVDISSVTCTMTINPWMVRGCSLLSDTNYT